ncbi:MlaD family protein [Azonexus sp.]|uniref:MlaD family protein n=1 Tax=Azonexus sp. TaxID=1872668 RepID=UPI0027BA6981|nr:MlaD family protein [Azonexus sp.]
MSRKTHSALIGGFVLGALSLALAAVFLLAGGDLWQKKTRYVMYFEDSVYGLKVGAPVVFRGVTIGTVKRIGIAMDSGTKSFFVPVEAELFPTSAADLSGQTIEINSLVSGADFVKEGLRAQLAMQSLLTGQLYVDLDFHSDAPNTLRGQGNTLLPEIPTIPTPVQQFKQRFEQVDFEKLLLDISAVASALRSKTESRELEATLHSLAKTMANLERLTGRLEQGTGPLLKDIHGVLQETRQAMTTAQAALQEISGVATGLRDATADNSLLQQNIQRALKETTRAATAVRQLSESIEQRPESLLRGK